MSALAIPYETSTRAGLAAIADTRDRFLQDPNTDLSRIRPAIARSWFRSAAAGVRPSGGHSRMEEPRIDGQTLSAARPLIRELEYLARDAGGYVTLTGPDGALVGDSSPQADERFQHGFVLREDICGTNSDGTALEEGHSMWVFSTEHYRDDMQGSCCFSALIRDPFRHNVRACLGLTLPESVAMAADPAATALIVEGIAAKITHELALRTSVKEQSLFGTYLTMSRRFGDVALLAMDGKNNIASNAALELLRDEDYSVIYSYVYAALQSRRAQQHRITLAGDRTVRIDIAPAGDPLDPAGAIAVIRPLPSRVVDAPPSSARTPWRPAPADDTERVFEGLIGSSKNFQHVVRLAKDACRHVHPVHLIGERGVGKYELGARIARGWESELVSIDCRGLDGAPCGVRDGLSQALAQGSSVLLRSAEMLPVGTARVVESVLQQYESPPIIMTMRRPTSTTTRLIAMLSSTEIVVPPLRTRPEDIPPLVRHFADEAGAKRPSASLLHILTQADWPGNTVQLRSVVAQTAMSATTQELTVDDLPQAFRHGMITGRLSRLEEAELHELRNALHEAGGNRKKAADILQIGRSTIYRRMDYYRRRGMVL